MNNPWKEKEVQKGVKKWLVGTEDSTMTDLDDNNDCWLIGRNFEKYNKFEKRNNYDHDSNNND